MNPLDIAYVELLRRGLIVLRQAIDSGRMDWIRAEHEFLHNIPSLIGEPNVLRHECFWECGTSNGQIGRATRK